MLSPQPPQSAKTYVIEGIWPVVRDDDWCGEWFAPAPSVLPRTHGIINGQELMAGDAPGYTTAAPYVAAPAAA